MMLKLDNSLQFCNDFKHLSVVSNAYPMSQADELAVCLGDSRYISTLNLTKGFFQVLLTKANKGRTYLTNSEGQYQYQPPPIRPEWGTH